MKVRNKDLCHTCRRRKLSCDGKRPTCSQCSNSNRCCEGYPDALFVPVGLASGTKPARKHPARGRSTLAVEPTSLYLPASRSNSPSDNLPCPMRSPPSTPLMRRDDVSCDYTVYPSLPVTLQDTMSLIIRNYVPCSEVQRDLTNPIPQSPRICGSWVTALPELASNADGVLGECLGSAMNALAISIVAHRTGRKLLQPISSHYERTIQLLRRDLQMAGSVYRNEQVAAVMCLALLEVLSPTNPRAWLVHVEGVSELIRSSSPDVFSTGVHHTLFIGFRPLLILKGLIHRKATYFAAQDWINKPFHCHKAAPLQELLGLAAKIPGILEKFDTLKDEPLNTTMAAAGEILGKFVGMRAELESWTCSFGADYPGPLYWRRATNNATKGHSNLLWFQDLSIANVLTYSWSFQIICLTHIEDLLTRFPGLAGRDIMTLDNAAGLRADCIELSVQIFQSMEYLLQDSFMLYGLSSAGFPLFTAVKALELDERGHAVLQTMDHSLIYRSHIQRTWISSSSLRDG